MTEIVRSSSWNASWASRPLFGGLMFDGNEAGWVLVPQTKMSALSGSPFEDWRVPGILLGVLVGAGFLFAAECQRRPPAARSGTLDARRIGPLTRSRPSELVLIGFQPLGGKLWSHRSRSLGTRRSPALVSDGRPLCRPNTETVHWAYGMTVKLGQRRQVLFFVIAFSVTGLLLYTLQLLPNIIWLAMPPSE